MTDILPQSDWRELADQLVPPAYFCDHAPQVPEPPLCRETVFFALMLIERPDTSVPQLRKAASILGRALREHGHDLIKAALDLEPVLRGQLLAQLLVQALVIPGQEGDREAADTAAVPEWIVPSKQEVERALERWYPEIYAELPKSKGRLRTSFWHGAGLADLPQARGYR